MEHDVTPLSSADVKWIADRRGEDLSRLRLKHHGDTHVLYLIDQIEARRKACAKVVNELTEAEAFVFPTLLSAEQCTSDALATYHASLIDPGERVLDMTAGLGIDAMHLCGRASEVVAVDIDRRCADALEINARLLGIDNLTPVCGDSVDYLSKTDEKFDVIFVDPARRGESGQRLYALRDTLPDVVGNMLLILSRCNRMIVKASPMLDCSAVANELSQWTPDIVAVGTRDECKELMLLIPGSGRQMAATIGSDGVASVVTIESGPSADVLYETPRPGMTLYEPFPEVTKIGAFNVVTAQFGVTKIGKSTHLYLSEKENTEFPGRRHEIVDVVEFSKKNVKNLVTKYGSLSVTTRDFPMTAAQFKHRFKTGESTSHRLWAVKSAIDGHILIVTSH